VRGIFGALRASVDRRFEVGFALIALCLGLFRLADKGLWVDEAVSLRFALQAPETWFHDNNMALFYALLSPIVRVFGDGERALRGLSVVCFALSAPLFYAFLRRAFDARVARIGTALLVANAYLLHFAQEARGYMLAVLLVIGANLALLRLSQADRAGWALAYGALIGLALYAHAFALWVLFAHGLAALWQLFRARHLLRNFLLAFALAALFAAPLVVRALLAGTTQISWLYRPTWESCLGMAALFVGGSLPLALTMLGLWLAFLALCVRALGRVPSDPDAGAVTHAFAHVLVAVWFVVPVVATLAISRFATPIAHPKYLLVTVPALLSGVAVASARLFAPRPRAILVVLLVALSAHGGFDYYMHYEKERWREAVALLVARFQDGDALVLDLRAPEPFDYYVLRAGHASGRLLPRPLFPDRAWSILWGEQRAHTAQEQTARFRSAERIWLVQNRGRDAALYAQLRKTHRSASRIALEPKDGDERALFAGAEGRIIYIESLVAADK
jgi:Dolichyl-phosphate-mannose-protein mannosyltransferase